MNRLVPAIAILLGWATAALAAEPATLTSLRAVHDLTEVEASHALPVAFEATVTYFRSYEGTMFLQDDGVALYVQAPTGASFAPGDRVLVKGATHNSFRNEVFGDSVTLLHHGSLPEPVPATFDLLMRGERDCSLVRVHAVLHTADLALSTAAPIHNIVLQMLTEGGELHANLDSTDIGAFKDLLDAEIEVTGVVSGRFDGKSQLTGIDLNVSSPAGIKILKRAPSSPWSLPATPMDQILNGFYEKNMTRRILVRGVVTYYQPGSLVVLQNGSQSLRIMTQSYVPLRIGDLADATGFPDLYDGFLTLTHGEVQDSQMPRPVKPLSATWQELSTSAHIFDLVSIEGLVVMEARGESEDEYVLSSGGSRFSAIYRHPDTRSQIPLPAMKPIPVGSTVRVTGICRPYSPDPYSGPVPFDILIRSFDDVSIVAKPSLLNIRNLIIVVGLLLALIMIAGVRGWTLERKMRNQSAVMAAHTKAEAAMERRRSRILEEINGARPLAEIIEEIAEMVSFSLHNAPAWCEITGGARLGNYPPEPQTLRVISQEIAARSGPPLGVFFAGLEPQTQATKAEADALSLGARLSALAIETRRLYADLRHRSEFDLLTDIHNRFSLDKRLDEVIDEARQNAGIFGLIYIDLDQFKQVNDLYGHQVGDLYLQEVAQRMKRQLRGGDILARLGGDEFAALVHAVRTRAGVEEIAQRLVQSFNEPFAVEGYTLVGSASVGVAIYPEDGGTKDSLLSAADAAMYVNKHTRRQTAETPAMHDLSGPGDGDRA